MDIIPIVSISLELLIAVLALVIALRGRPYMLGFAVTFGIYVYYDLVRHYDWAISESVLSISFLIATITALIAMVGILKTPLKKK